MHRPAGLLEIGAVALALAMTLTFLAFWNPGSGRGIDLLTLVDPERHAIKENWAREIGTRVPIQRIAGNRIMIPTAPPEEYDLTVVAEREGWDLSLGIGLVWKGRQFSAVSDGWPREGNFSGLHLVSGQEAKRNVTSRQGQLMKKNVPSTIVCSVRHEAVWITVDGKEVIRYEGDPGRRTVGGWYEVPDPRALSIRSWDTEWRIHKVELRPVEGEGEVLR